MFDLREKKKYCIGWAMRYTIKRVMVNLALYG